MYRIVHVNNDRLHVPVYDAKHRNNCSQHELFSLQVFPLFLPFFELFPIASCPLSPHATHYLLLLRFRGAFLHTCEPPSFLALTRRRSLVFLLQLSKPTTLKLYSSHQNHPLRSSSG